MPFGEPKFEQQLAGAPESEESREQEEIFERVANNSAEFDKETATTHVYSEEEIRRDWQKREWCIGGATVQAIGIRHVPETFLEFRQEIEKAIQESDIVVNEFAPETLGFYDKDAARRLKSIKSRFNESYNLEQLRQAYLKHERQWGIGGFHHEIELLAAKYGKDMALADLNFFKNPEELLQDNYLYAYGAKEIAERAAALKKIGLYTGAAAMAIAGLGGFISELQKPMSRRKFLKLGLMAGAAAIAGVTPKITETPPRTAVKKSAEMADISNAQKLEMLRDPKLAETLQQLSKSGYKKIAFIYGTNHLDGVEDYLNYPEKRAKQLATGQEVIKSYNPDAFRVFRLSDRENNSERFVASKKKSWKRIKLGE